MSPLPLIKGSFFNAADYCNHMQFNMIDSIGDGTLMPEKLCPREWLRPILIMAALNI